MSEPTSKIVEYDKGNPVLEIHLEGFKYGFSLQPVNEKWRDWLKGILLDQMARIDERAFKRGQQSVIDPIKNALNLH